MTGWQCSQAFASNGLALVSVCALVHGLVVLQQLVGGVLQQLGVAARRQLAVGFLSSSSHTQCGSRLLVRWHPYHQQLSVSFGFGHVPLHVLL